MTQHAPSDAQRAETRQFFDAMFAGVPDDMHTYLWTLQDKRTHWLPTVDVGALADAAVDIATSPPAGAPPGAMRDTYLAVSCAAQLPPVPSKRPHTRINSASSGGIFGLWADVDFTDPVAHKKFNLPANQEEAQALVDAMGLEPSLVVFSGHGLQVWWLFHEFWRFESDEDRGRAKTLAARWIGTMRARAAERNQIVDPVYDLARVMRIPGTWNLKGAEPAAVRLLRDSGARYDPDDFLAHVLDDDYLAKQGVTSTSTYQVGDLELTESASPDFELFNDLKDDSDIFEKTWDKKRSDLMDQSPSTYDMSLASQAAQAGWNDQQIADLIIAFRKKHKLGVEKALRRDYIMRTIAKARDGQARLDPERVEDVTAALEVAVVSQDQSAIDHARRDVLTVIGEQLGLEVTRIARYTSEPPTFRLITPTHAIDLGQGDGILRVDKFKTSVYSATGHVIPRFKAPQWDEVATLISRAWVEEDLGFETTARGEVHSWLSEYVEMYPPIDSAEEAVSMGQPFINDKGQTVILGPALRRFLWNSLKELVNAKQLGAKLRDFGATPEQVAVKVDGKRTTKSGWVLPEAWQTS